MFDSKTSNHPWLDKIIIDLKERLIIIEKKSYKEDNIDLLCLKPNHFNEEQCSLHHGNRNKKDQHQYISNEIIGIVNTPFDQILMFLQPLIACIPLKE